jgi:hypothetical protein
MKYFLNLGFALVLCIGVSAQAKTDTVAVMILDQTNHVIGDLSSVSFTLNTRSDVEDHEIGVVTNFGKSQVYFDGPDKMMVNSNNEKGHRSFCYNGDYLAFYSFNENNFALIETPSTTIEMIDSINYMYGIEFPAADFFYPTFSQDLLDESEEIIYNGKKIVNGEECFHIISKQKEMTIQFWISNDALFLPAKMLIMYNKSNLQYEASFDDWNINPILPASMFDFLPPPGAREVYLLPKNN